MSEQKTENIIRCKYKIGDKVVLKDEEYLTPNELCHYKGGIKTFGEALHGGYRKKIRKGVVTEITQGHEGIVQIMTKYNDEIEIGVAEDDSRLRRTLYTVIKRFLGLTP